MMPMTSAASDTFAVSGSRWFRPYHPCHPGVRGTRPNVGLNPTRPQKLAGIRTEPPPSEPRATGTIPAATAAAPPPVDPPGVRDVSQGLSVPPEASLAQLPR